MRFRNRQEAGRLLAQKMAAYKNQPSIIYALPRGGLIPGVELAQALGAPLDLILSRKVGHPRYPEYAICAVTEDGHMVCNQDEMQQVDPAWLQQASEAEQQEAVRRRERYLVGRQPLSAAGKTAIITDDGIATGLTMVAAIYEVNAREPDKIVVAAPVIPQDIARVLHEYVDEVIALETPLFFRGAIGAYYEQFEQVDDETVLQLLRQCAPESQTQKGDQ